MGPVKIAKGKSIGRDMPGTNMERIKVEESRMTWAGNKKTG